jgi:hypothetical protein
MDSINISLDLPTGWNSTTTNNRHANYDPVIVTAFAIILACSITGAIAATVWRFQHLRNKKLKEDLERATKSKRIEDGDSDVSVEEEKLKQLTKKKRRRRKVVGSGGAAGGAGKSSSTVWRPGSRFVARLRSRSRWHKSTEQSTIEPSIALSRPASPQLDPPPHDPPVILVTAEPEQDTTSSIRSRPPSDSNLPLSSTLTADPTTTPRPDPERIPATAVPLPVSSIHLSHSFDQNQSMPNIGNDPTTPPSPTVEGHTSKPPAYRGEGGRRTLRGTEKAPLPGLEAEYDERDLNQWRASRPAADSTSVGVRSRSRARSTVEPELDVQSPPPLTTHVRRMHIATDDKAELARLRSLSDQPDTPFPPQAFPIPDGPTVPDFGVVDDWYAEAQLEQVSPLGRFSSPSSPAPTPSRLTLPPPPVPYLLSRHSSPHDPRARDTSYHDAHDMHESYTFRPVWNKLTPRVGPSAPPMMEEDSSNRELENMEALVPSAPPLPDDPINSLHLPSAPQLWDEENESLEPPRSSAPPLEAVSFRGREWSDSVSGGSGENSNARPDVDVRVRWVQQRQVEMEGVGLPKYEP